MHNINFDNAFFAIFSLIGFRENLAVCLQNFAQTDSPLTSHTLQSLIKKKKSAQRKTNHFESFSPCVYDSIINTIIGMRKALRSLVVVHYPSSDSPRHFSQLIQSSHLKSTNRIEIIFSRAQTFEEIEVKLKKNL